MCEEARLADVVEARRLIVDRGKADQRFLGRPLLDQHGAPVGQIAGEARAGTDELAARAIERCEALGHRAVLHAMDDAQELHPAALPV